MKDFRALAGSVSSSAATLREAIPEAMRGLTHLGRTAYREGALAPKTKELIALAIAISQRWDECVAYQARRTAELRASRDEVIETIAVAVQMGGAPAMVYGGQALQAFDAFEGAGIAMKQQVADAEAVPALIRQRA